MSFSRVWTFYSTSEVMKSTVGSMVGLVGDHMMKSSPSDTWSFLIHNMGYRMIIHHNNNLHSKTIVFHQFLKLKMGDRTNGSFIITLVLYFHSAVHHICVEES